MPTIVTRPRISKIKRGRESSELPLDVILDDCLRDLHVRRISAVDCSVRYPARAAELLPLLQVAAALEQLSESRPAPEFRKKTRQTILSYPDPPSLSLRLAALLRSAGRRLARSNG